jgi:hypothetical protein
VASEAVKSKEDSDAFANCLVGDFPSTVSPRVTQKGRYGIESSDKYRTIVGSHAKIPTDFDCDIDRGKPREHFDGGIFREVEPDRRQIRTVFLDCWGVFHKRLVPCSSADFGVIAKYAGIRFWSYSLLLLLLLWVVVIVGPRQLPL